MKEETTLYKLGPFLYAIASLFCVPLLIITMLISCAIFLCAWPIIPILSYYERKEELKDND